MSNFMLGGGSFGKSYTLNFDGSHNNQFQKAGAGCVIRDSEGELIVAASYNLTDAYPDCNVAIAEAVALRNGLKLAKTNNIKLNLIKGDSKEVLDHVRGMTFRAPKAPLSAIIVEIRIALHEQRIDPLSEVELIDREANRVADKLALFGSRLETRSVMVYKRDDEVPDQVAELIRQEKSSSGGSSSIAAAIGTAGAVAAGIAMLGWGVSKLLSSGESSNENQQHHNKAKAPTIWDMLDNISSTVSNTPKNNHGFYTLNVDGLDSNQLEKAAAGCIIRDQQGDLVVAGAYNLDGCYPGCHIGIAEAVALQKGLKLAKKYGIKLDLVKGDNEEVINRVLGRERRPPKVAKMSEIIQDIRNSLYEQSIDPETQLELVPSEANKVADTLALLGRKLLTENTYTRGDVLPIEVVSLIEQDKKIIISI